MQNIYVKEILVRGTPNKINKIHEKKSTYQIKDNSKKTNIGQNSIKHEMLSGSYYESRDAIKDSSCHSPPRYFPYLKNI